MKILGISAYYHDSAAALVSDGDIVAAAQEERFSRKKHDARFPARAIESCLKQGGSGLADIDYVVFYDKPLLKFERLLETYLANAPRGLRSFVMAMPVWLKEKLYLKNLLRTSLASIGNGHVAGLPPLLFTEHHQAHAASAFFPSPFQRAGILCLDAVGEWATSSVWLGEGNRLIPQWQIDFPHSLGLLYSAFTYYCGFRVNSGEYKLMGLAPYGTPRYVDLILDKMIDLKDDGTFRLNLSYFDYVTGLRMTSPRFHELFGGQPRHPDGEVTQRHMDLASSIQRVIELAMLRLANSVRKELQTDYLCMAGGVALNCVANGQILRKCGFKDIWIQPAATDSGGALGAALSVWHEFLGNGRDFPVRQEGKASDPMDGMNGAFLGPNFSEDEVRSVLDRHAAHYQQLHDEPLFARIATLLEKGSVIGWFQGRMEFGPRALGARSILGDPRHPNMQSVLNLKIKKRESFRPFAPAVIAEKASEYFEIDRASPYMLLVADVGASQRLDVTAEADALFGIQKLSVLRSKIPAVTHVDYSARLQTVHRETNPRFYELLRAFEAHTGCAVLVNTSFNVRGEPIVCTPDDAYRCFMSTDIDYLVIENFILAKTEQLGGIPEGGWRNVFEQD